MAYTFRHGDRPLPDYTIQRGVGRGGFGEVYYAISDGGREVALKYLRENPHVELRGVSHCINLKSPHLVTIFDVAKSAEGDYFVIMEYISGPSLRDLLIAEPNGLGVPKAAYLMREMAKGLGHLHERGIVHRDLKPGNIFYDDGYVKIGDYGLSKFISVSRHSAQTASIGTVHYMAPEVGSGDYSRTIDIYALGVILYEMLLGKLPFDGSSMGEVLMKHLTAQPELNGLPAPFGEVIRKSLAKDPNERYQNVHEMVGDVFEVTDIRNSLVGFNPTGLSTVAARHAEDVCVSPRPVHRPPPPPPRPVERPYPHVREVETGKLPASPEALRGSLRYAGFWIRVLATIIDALVVGAASAWWPNGGMYAGLGVLYSGLLIGKWNGQTLGKRACGIKVISADGRVCGVGQAFVRAAADLLNWLTVGLSYLVVAFDHRKRGVHDHLARTLHVYAVG